MKILLTVEYFGTGYAGWQYQKNALSVQEVLEEKLSLVLQSPVRLVASGRTDSGVHALAQKAHFSYEGSFPVERLACAVNTTLPSDIRVKSAVQVGEAFHAQYDAKRKTYRYQFYVARTLSPTRHLTHAQIPYDAVEFEKMREAAKKLIGKHDFTGFSSTGSGINDTIRTIYAAELTRMGDEIYLEIIGNGFLYNMVRIIAGTLAYIGVGKLPVSAIDEVFVTKNRKMAGKTYPPQGLYLKEVIYEEENEK